MIKRGHLKNFVKKDAMAINRLEERREPIRERAIRPVNNGSSETISMIVRDGVVQPLRANK